MNPASSNPLDLFGIAAVERDTGLSKDTLRVWERRYGFPLPLRDANDERVYPTSQVEKLRLLRRLMDCGHRPGKIVPKSLAELSALAAEQGSSQADAAAVDNELNEELAHFLQLLRTHQADALREAMTGKLMRLGIEQFVIQLAAPMSKTIGEAWARGELQIHEEHLFTEQLTHLLRSAIDNILRRHAGPPATPVRPRVLLTTFPQEPHSLGLLMAETLMALGGCDCMSLGVQTPVSDIVTAAAAHKVDIVALSFSPVMNSAQVVDGLLTLRSHLDPGIEIWAGGSCPALSRRALSNVRTLRPLSAIEAAVHEWRARHAIQR
jgi:DNA-binding transcriptional MerR regulator/methylmalonyl-CoA mutase cobalamin-binding subunit